MKTTDRAALDDWYAVATASEITVEPLATLLLGQDITVARHGKKLVVREGEKALPVEERYGCVWTSLGMPQRPLFDITGIQRTDRRFVPCGWVELRASGLRVVENFLDMAHFPFVHADILGSEPHTEVPEYRSEIRRDVDEVWATNCTFFQERIAATETQGDFVQLTYRVPTPFNVMLYRVRPFAPDRLDAIALFIQPMEAGHCRAQAVMYLVDQVSSHNDLLLFEQTIFLQDRIIAENQRPLLLPLEPRAEIPTRADTSSIAYRRWLKEKGLWFGTTAQNTPGTVAA